MMDFQIENISYKRNTIDRGIVLGSRRSLFDLSERKYPCKAKHADKNRLVSKRSPQRSNFRVYIPVDHLTPDLVFVVLDRPYTSKTAAETTYRVLDVQASFVTLDIIQAGKPRPRINKAMQKRLDACQAYKQTQPIAKEDAWFVANPESWIDDFPASSEEQASCKQTLKDVPAALPEKSDLNDSPLKADHSCSTTAAMRTVTRFPVLPKPYRLQRNNNNRVTRERGWRPLTRLARKLRPLPLPPFTLSEEGVRCQMFFPSIAGRRFSSFAAMRCAGLSMSRRRGDMPCIRSQSQGTGMPNAPPSCAIFGSITVRLFAVIFHSY
jgi:hypothetical protein